MPKKSPVVSIDPLIPRRDGLRAMAISNSTACRLRHSHPNFPPSIRLDDSGRQSFFRASAIVRWIDALPTGPTAAPIHAITASLAARARKHE